ncbi:MAG: hypothetical protein CL933_01940 [Deltaproteobacteria bacterium]|nr:hypothetical protein [Deltaproteobacteria bacterium]
MKFLSAGVDLLSEMPPFVLSSITSANSVQRGVWKLIAQEGGGAKLFNLEEDSGEPPSSPPTPEDFFFYGNTARPEDRGASRSPVLKPNGVQVSQEMLAY